MIHDRENSEDTERHLSENRRKFESDCVFLLKLMHSGRRLTSDDVHEMKINDRRLRNLFEDGKCQREWKLNEKGKRVCVEYFVNISKRPTKRDVVTFYQEELFI